MYENNIIYTNYYLQSQSGAEVAWGEGGGHLPPAPL